MNKLYAALGALVLGAALFLGGIYTGRKTMPTKTIETIKYVELDPIHDSIPYPVPVRVTVPADTADIILQCIEDGIYAELFPEKVRLITDTVIIDKTDTSRILADWASVREYDQTLFDIDTLGRVQIRTSVQYNRLNTIHYDFTPIQKVITRETYMIRKFTPFVGAGASSFPSCNAEAGFFLKQSWGVAVQGNYYLNPSGISQIPKFDVGVKVLKMF